MMSNIEEASTNNIAVPHFVLCLMNRMIPTLQLLELMLVHFDFTWLVSKIALFVKVHSEILASEFRRHFQTLFLCVAVSQRESRFLLYELPFLSRLPPFLSNFLGIYLVEVRFWIATYPHQHANAECQGDPDCKDDKQHGPIMLFGGHRKVTWIMGVDMVKLHVRGSKYLGISLI